MPSYLQLASEPVWVAQYVPANLDALLIEPLREFYGLGPASIGAPGDNNHLYGRHRSAAWDRQSRYCTDRSYGTTDARDHSGDQNWYRACDVGIQGQTLYDASQRMDELARSGACPGLAEWFGTFDGQNVVGWYEGHPSSSDDSHLWHLHLGLWNQYANDPATLKMLFATVTGQATPEQGDDDMVLVGGAEGKFWVADGFYHRELANAAVAKALADAAKTSVLNYGPNTSAAQMLAIIGPTPYLQTATPGGGPVNLTPEAVEAVADAVNDDAAQRLAD